MKSLITKLIGAIGVWSSMLLASLGSLSIAGCQPDNQLPVITTPDQGSPTNTPQNSADQPEQSPTPDDSMPEKTPESPPSTPDTSSDLPPSTPPQR